MPGGTEKSHEKYDKMVFRVRVEHWISRIRTSTRQQHLALALNLVTLLVPS